MYRLARELLRRGKGRVTNAGEDLPRSLDALCLSPVRTLSHATVRTRARSAGSLLVKDNVLKIASINKTSVLRRGITGESISGANERCASSICMAGLSESGFYAVKL